MRVFFSKEDARIVLSTRIPQVSVKDRLAWTKTKNGQDSVKTGYQLSREHNLRAANVTQANDCSKIWRLNLPHNLGKDFFFFLVYVETTLLSGKD